MDFRIPTQRHRDNRDTVLKRAQQMIAKKIIGRIRRSYQQSAYLLRNGNILSSLIFFICSVTYRRYPVVVSIGADRFTIRPSTPDLDVLIESAEGEFNQTIKAAAPLKYGTIIDAGGYIGTAAIAFAKAFPQAQIVTLEPSRVNFEILRRNILGYPNIIALNKALGSTEGAIPLVNRGTGEWGFSIVQAPSDCALPKALHNVEVTTVPAILAELQSNGVDVLKLDIEGGEYELLKDRPSWLACTRILLAELHDRIVPGCESLFKAVTADRVSTFSGEKVLSVKQSV